MNEHDMFHDLKKLQQLLTGSVDSQSMAMLNNVMTETIGMSMHNAVSNQHNAQLVNTAAATSACARILAATAKVPAQVITEQKTPVTALARIQHTHQPGGDTKHPSS